MITDSSHIREILSIVIHNISRVDPFENLWQDQIGGFFGVAFQVSNEIM